LIIEGSSGGFGAASQTNSGTNQSTSVGGAGVGTSSAPPQ